MTILTQILFEYGFMIISVLLTALFSLFTAKIKGVIEKANIDDTKRRTAEACVRAAEQMYRDLDGSAKLEKAKQSILQILTEKGIKITETEMNVLIESGVNLLK